MPTQVNSNSIVNFQKFVDFANGAYATDGAKGADVIARFTGMPKGDYNCRFASFLRTSEMKTANDQVRDLFLKSVAGMFGGEKYIPDLVRDNMKLEDFGKGKPLTARRIKLVATAVNMLGGGKFQDAASVGRATAKGYTAAELPKLARREPLPAGDELQRSGGRGRRARPRLEGPPPLRLWRPVHAQRGQLQEGARPHGQVRGVVREPA